MCVVNFPVTNLLVVDVQYLILKLKCQPHGSTRQKVMG